MQYQLKTIPCLVIDPVTFEKKTCSLPRRDQKILMINSTNTDQALNGMYIEILSR